MTDKKTNTDKTKKTQRKNSYRMRFTLPNGQMVQHTAHTKAERDSIRGWVDKLISSQRTGVANVEAEEWAQTRPKGALRDFLVKWGLLEDNSDTERTLADVYQVFVADGKGEDRTIINRKAAADRLSAFFGSSCLLRNVTRQRAGDFINDLETKGNLQTGKGLGKNSVVSIVKRCKTFFRYALEMGWIKENPFSRFTATYTPNYDRWHYVTKEDTIRAIEEGTANKAHRVIIALVRFCGLRGASELSRLTFDASCYHPSTADKPGELLVHNTKVERHVKHGKPRPIPLIPEVERLVQDLWESIPEGENRFFPSMTKASNPGIIVKRVFERIGVNTGEMYNLRRSYVSDLMAGGMHEKDPALFELLAGHDIVMSLRNYQIITDSRKEGGAQAFMEIMSVNPEGKPSTTFGATSMAQTPLLTPCDKPHQDETSGDKNAQTLKNKDLSQKESPSCILMQPGLIPPRGIERPSKDPYFYGISANAENSSTTFGATQNFIEQLLTVFDKLEAAEQEQLIQRLTARLKATVQ